MRRRLLIIWHSRTGASEAMARAVCEGANAAAKAEASKDEITIDLKRADTAEPDDILSASALIFVCPENLAAISGVMKDMFDRCYYLVLGKIEGRAYATIITAGSDGRNAETQIDRIATGWRLKRVADPVIINCSAQTPEEILAAKTLSINELKKGREMGGAILHGLEIGMF